MQRIATYDLGHALGWQLFVMTGGHGWDYFQAKREDPRPLSERPHVSLHWDTEGTDCAFATFSLCKKKVRITCWDVLHKIYRIVWNSM